MTLTVAPAAQRRRSSRLDRDPERVMRKANSSVATLSHTRDRSHRLSAVVRTALTGRRAVADLNRARGTAHAIRVLATLLRLAARVACEPIRGIQSPATVRFLGYEVSAARSWDLLFLFLEIFVLETYRFETANPNPFIIDCGANVGMATMYFKLTHPQASVLAFEPDPRTFGLLKRNVVNNALSNVQLEQAALCADDREVDFFVDVAHSGGLQNSLDPRRAQGVRTTVRGVRMSSFIDRPVDLLKLDVEGAELAVLGELAASGRLNQVAQLIIEFHHHLDPDEDRLSELLTLLERSGFGYQVNAYSDETQPLRGGYQDVGVIAYRKHANE